MAAQAQHRIHRLTVYIIASCIVLALAAFLFVHVGWEATKVVLSGTGLVATSIIAGEFLTRHWLWRTWLGKLVGFPPNYSGEWEGTVYRSYRNTDAPTENRVEVEISQNVTQIAWHQQGYDDNGQKIAESHFILGEVIDEHRKWDAILGVYEVQRSNGSKDHGMSLVRANKGGNELSGVYCGMNGNVGTITVTKKGS
jgi:hypothetical protein